MQEQPRQAGDAGDAHAPAPATGAPVWLSGAALGAAPLDEALRGWLLERGSLTRRLRALHGEDFRLRLLHQHTSAAAHHGLSGDERGEPPALVREVVLECAGVPWVFARTVVPGATLQRHAWLAELAEQPLGESLYERDGVERGPFEFCALQPADVLVRRAMIAGTLPPHYAQPLWARRSAFFIEGAMLLVNELFLPGVAARVRATPDESRMR